MAQQEKKLNFDYLADLIDSQPGQGVIVPNPNFKGLADPRQIPVSREGQQIENQFVQGMQGMQNQYAPQMQPAMQKYAQQQQARADVPAAFVQPSESIGSPWKRGLYQNIVGSAASAARLIPKQAFQSVGVGVRGFGRVRDDDPGAIIAENAAKWAQSNLKPEDFATGKYARGIEGVGDAIDPKRIYQVIAEQGPQTLGFMAATMANPAFGFAVMGAVEGGETAERIAEYERSTGQQVDPTFKRFAPVIVGSVNAALEKVGIDAMLGKLPGVRSRITKALLGAMGEGGTEALQQVSQLLAQAGYNKPDRDQVASELIDSFYAGTILGGGIASVRQGYGFIRSRQFHKNLETNPQTEPANPEEWLAQQAYRRGYTSASEVDRAFLAAEDITGADPTQQYYSAQAILQNEFPLKKEAAESITQDIVKKLDVAEQQKTAGRNRVDDYFAEELQRQMQTEQPVVETKAQQKATEKPKEGSLKAEIVDRGVKMAAIAAKIIDGDKIDSKEKLFYIKHKKRIDQEVDRLKELGAAPETQSGAKPDVPKELPADAMAAIDEATGGTMAIDNLAGKKNLPKRKKVMSAITGEPATNRGSGITAIKQAIAERTGVEPDNQIIADFFNERLERPDIEKQQAELIASQPQPVEQPKPAKSLDNMSETELQAELEQKITAEIDQEAATVPSAQQEPSRAAQTEQGAGISVQKPAERSTERESAPDILDKIANREVTDDVIEQRMKDEAEFLQTGLSESGQRYKALQDVIDGKESARSIQVRRELAEKLRDGYYYLEGSNTSPLRLRNRSKKQVRQGASPAAAGNRFVEPDQDVAVRIRALESGEQPAVGQPVDEPAQAREGLTKDAFVEKILSHERFDFEQVGAVTGIVEAAANAWVKRTGKTENEFYDQIADIRFAPFSAVDFGADGRALINTLETGNADTIIRDLAYFFRRMALSDTDIEIAAKWAGEKNPRNWTEAGDQKFADAFVDYLNTGKAPSSKLRQIFELFKNWLSNLRQKLDVAPDIRNVFDRLLGGPENVAGGELQAVEPPPIAGPEVTPDITDMRGGELVRADQPMIAGPEIAPQAVARLQPEQEGITPPPTTQKVIAKRPKLPDDLSKTERSELNQQLAKAESINDQHRVVREFLEKRKKSPPSTTTEVAEQDAESAAGSDRLGEGELIKMKIDQTAAGAQVSFAGPASVPPGKIKPKKAQKPIEGAGGVGLFGTEAPTADQVGLFDETQQESGDEPTKPDPQKIVLRSLNYESETNISEGTVYKTATGRLTSPFPKVRNLEKGNLRDRKKEDEWLIANAIAEAESRGDDANVKIFKQDDIGKVPPASAAMMLEYLFGKPVPVQKSPFKTTSTATAQTGAPSLAPDAPPTGGESLLSPPSLRPMEYSHNGLTYVIGHGARNNELVLTQTLVGKKWVNDSDDLKSVFKTLAKESLGNNTDVTDKNLQKLIDYASKTYGIVVVAKKPGKVNVVDDMSESDLQAMLEQQIADELQSPPQEKVVEESDDVEVQADPPEPVSELSANQLKAVKALYELTKQSGDIYRLSGNRHRELRRAILQGLLGKKLTLAESGVTRLQDEFYKIAQPEGDTSAQKEDNFRKWVQSFAGKPVAKPTDNESRQSGISRGELKAQLLDFERQGIIERGMGERLFLLFDTAAQNIASWYSNTTVEKVYGLFGGVQYREDFEHANIEQMADKWRFPDGVPAGYSLTGRLTVENGVYLVQTFQKNSPDVIIHEFGHFFRQLMPKSVAGQLRSWAENGKDYDPDSKWSREAEERYARAFEKFMATGEVPEADFNLRRVFEAIKKALLDIFRVYDKPGLREISLSPEALSHFQKLLAAQKEQNGQAFSKGNRVQIRRDGHDGIGRYGEVVRVNVIAWEVSNYGQIYKSESKKTYYYYVKTDNGAEFGPLSADEIVATDVPYDGNVPKDIQVAGTLYAPQRVDMMIRAKKDHAAATRKRAKRRRKAEYRNADLNRARRYDGEVAEMERLLSEWKETYPDEAAELFPEDKKAKAEKPADIAPPTTLSSDGVTMTLNAEKDGVELSFDTKPSDEVRNRLKANKFRWSRRNRVWYAKQTPARIALAEELAGKGKAVSETETKASEAQASIAESERKLAGDRLDILHGFRNNPMSYRLVSEETLTKIVEKRHSDENSQKHQNMGLVKVILQQLANRTSDTNMREVAMPFLIKDINKNADTTMELMDKYGDASDDVKKTIEALLEQQYIRLAVKSKFDSLFTKGYYQPGQTVMLQGKVGKVRKAYYDSDGIGYVYMVPHLGGGIVYSVDTDAGRTIVNQFFPSSNDANTRYESTVRKVQRVEDDAPPSEKAEPKPETDEIKGAFDDLKGHLRLADIATTDPYKSPKAIKLVSKVLAALAKSGVKDFRTAVERFEAELGAEVTVQLELAIQTGWKILRRMNGEFSEPLSIREVIGPNENVRNMDEAQKTPMPDTETEGIPNIKDNKPGAQYLIGAVATAIQSGLKIDNPILTSMADHHFGGTIADGTYDSSDKYDAFEAGVNLWIRKFEPNSIERLREKMEKFPTQNQRTKEKDEWQQFSTPPTEAFVAAYALNPQKDEVVLEPSAGVGGLAVFAQNSGANVIVNEMSKRRAGLLIHLGFETYSVNAEYLDDLLPQHIRPTAIIMNPPFSATAGRLSNNQTKYGARHIEQALRRLEPGGRLVGIVGEGMAIGKASFDKWWQGIAKKYNVRANIGVKGNEYRKYGTTFGNQIIVIDKAGATPGQNWSEQIGNMVVIENATLEEAQNALKEIRQSRNKVAEVKSDVHDKLGGGRAETAGGRGTAQSSRPGQRGDDSQQPESSKGPETVQGGESRTNVSQSVGAEQGSTANTGSQVQVGGGRVENVGGITSETVDAEEIVAREDEAGGRFVEYKPVKLRISGAKPHPAKIVESQSMAAIDPPDITHKIKLPKELIESGALSDLQIESIAYAGQRFDQRLPGGQRAGYFIGDGTGVGKGRQMAGITQDQWNYGTRRILWLSVSQDLMKDAQRDLEDTGFKGKITNLSDHKANADIDFGDGVLYATYHTFISSGKGKNAQSRIEQVKKWLGNDCLICFDEAHKGKNGLANEMGKPSQTAVKIIQIQDELPDAKVTYMSATGATEVRNMAYMTRLGLWGEGTPFAGGFMDFLNEVEAGGIGTMEMVARDMKALGMYASRSISFDGVEYREITHNLTADQIETYNIAARAWQSIQDSFQESLRETAASGRARAAAMQQFWSTHQRFFKTILTAMKVPSAIKEVERALNDNKSVILSIIGTNEQRTKQKVAEALNEGKDLDSLDFTPREAIGSLIANAYPIHQYTEMENEHGTVVKVPLLDNEGNHVVSQVAIQMRDELLDSLGDMNLPDNPLDQIINHFGPESVAELTGRKMRLIRDKNTGKMEYVKRKPEGVKAQDVNTHEMKMFQNGKKRIAIISTAAATGISLHASNKAKNKQRRVQITLELGWSADVQMQTFGRSHRSNQVMPPEYVLLSSSAGGEKRFSATIARRLSSLGALTKGQRDTSGGDDLAKYNFETEEGKIALYHLYSAIENYQIGDDLSRFGGIDPSGILEEMGIVRPDSETDKMQPEHKTDVPKFLNRLLALEIEKQNALFDAFFEKFEHVVRQSKEQGTFDDGVADIKGESIRVHRDKPVVHTDNTTGAHTRHYIIEVDNKTNPVSYDEISKYKGEFYQLNSNKRYYYVENIGGLTDPTTGRIQGKYRVTAPSNNSRIVSESDLRERYTIALRGDPAIKEWWDNEVANYPEVKTTTVNVIGGALLPIWNQLKAGGVRRLKIVRIQADSGERVVGVKIPNRSINLVLRRLGVGGELKTPDDIFEEVYNNGGSVILEGPSMTADRPLRLTTGRIGGQKVIELENLAPAATRQVESLGLLMERQDFRKRWYLPRIREKEVIENMLKVWPLRITQNAPSTPEQDARPAIDLDVEFDDFRRKKPVYVRDAASFRYTDERLEQDHRASHGLETPGLLERATELWHTVNRRFTRGAHEHLPRTATFAPLRFELLRLQKQRSVANDKTIKNIRRVVEGMTPDEYNVFERLVLVRDLAEEAKYARQLPGYWTPKLVQTELLRLNAHAATMPIVQHALQIRKEMWNDIKGRHIDAMKAIGKDVKGKFEREDYYRHQVLAYAQTMGKVKGESKLRSPETAGYLKRRKGKQIESADGKAQSINTFYVQAEFEVMAQMLYDIERAGTLKLVDDMYNVAGDLKDKARALNDGRVRQYFVQQAAALGSANPEEEGGKLYRQMMNKKQAIGFSKLQKMADDKLLPFGPNDRWADVVAEIREGTHSPALFKYLAWGIRTNQRFASVAQEIFAGISQKKKNTRKLLERTGQFVDWRDLIDKKSQRIWQAREGNIMFMAVSIPERFANALMEGGLEEVGITKDDLSRIFAVGGKHREFVLPHEVADQLDNLVTNIERSTFGEHSRAMLTRWKWWTLLSPRRAFKYNARNLTGDADAVFVGNPDSFRYMKKAITDLAGYFKTGEANPAMKQWIEFGGIQSLLQSQEITQIGKLAEIEAMIPGQITTMDKLKKYPKAYAHLVRLGTDFREGLLRYASFLSYLNQIEKNGVPKNYGTSIRQEVDALPTAAEKAYQLSNDLLGAYDDVSVIGQELRAKWVPFWSWKEVNTKRYVRLWKNAAQDGRLAMAVGRKLLGVTVRSPLLLMKFGKLFLASHALWAAMQVWNYTFFRDDEEDLPASIKSRPHLLFGRKDNGEIIYFHQLGAIGDFMQWVGVEDWPYIVRDLMNGRRTFGEVAEKSIKSAPNIMWQGLRPEIKIGAEQLFGAKTYPDVFEPRSVRDKVLAAFEVLQLGEEYKLIANLPAQGYGKSWEKAAYYTIDADRAAYITIWDEKERFRRRRGEAYTPAAFGSANPRSKALYNFKLSLRYKDKSAATKYLIEYANLGGTKNGMLRSIETLHPLAGFNNDERKKFAASLDENGRRALVQAMRHYKTVVEPKRGTERVMGSILSRKRDESILKELSKIGVDRIFILQNLE